MNFLDPYNLELSLAILLSVVIVMAIVLWWSSGVQAEKLRFLAESYSPLGKMVLRITVGLSLVFSALTASFLTPALPLWLLPGASAIQLILLVIGVLIMIGLFTEAWAICGIVIFAIAVGVFHLHMLSYASYLAAFVAFLFFGFRPGSLDSWLLGPRKTLKKWSGFEFPILRVAYGLSLGYSLIHAQFIYTVIPPSSEPLVFAIVLVALSIASCIVLGFETRFTVIASLCLATIFIAFFGISVWQYLILYGMALYLVTAKGTYGIDNWIKKRLFDRHIIKI